MTSALRAELRKLLTVRSTYFLTGFVWLVVSVVGFYVIGYQQNQAALLRPDAIQSVVFGSLQLVGLIAAIVAVLLLAHEYRYNTINYSLTFSRSRSFVLLAKFIVVSVYAVILALVSMGLVIGFVHAGAATAGHVIGPQNYQLNHLLAQTVFSVWGNAMAGLILTFLIRNLVGSIVALFVIPAIEQLLSLLLKSNTGYLPFTSLSAVTPINGAPTGTSFSIGKSAIIYAIYIVVFGIIAWQLFLRRDAS